MKALCTLLLLFSLSMVYAQTGESSESGVEKLLLVAKKKAVDFTPVYFYAGKFASGQDSTVFIKIRIKYPCGSYCAGTNTHPVQVYNYDYSSVYIYQPEFEVLFQTIEQARIAGERPYQDSLPLTTVYHVSPGFAIGMRRSPGVDPIYFISINGYKVPIKSLDNLQNVLLQCKEATKRVANL